MNNNKFKRNGLWKRHIDGKAKPHIPHKHNILSNAFHLNCDRLLWFVVDFCTTRRQTFGFLLLKRETHAAIESIKTKYMQRNNSIFGSFLFICFALARSLAAFENVVKLASGLLCAVCWCKSNACCRRQGEKCECVFGWHEICYAQTYAIHITDTQQF